MIFSYLANVVLWSYCFTFSTLEKGKTFHSDLARLNRAFLEEILISEGQATDKLIKEGDAFLQKVLPLDFSQDHVEKLGSF